MRSEDEWRSIVLDASGWRTSDDVYSALFAAVGAPAWHGRNLDALDDSIGTGGINSVEVPYALRIRGLRAAPDDVRRFVDRFAELVLDLRREGVRVSLVIDS